MALVTDDVPPVRPDNHPPALVSAPLPGIAVVERASASASDGLFIARLASWLMKLLSPLRPAIEASSVGTTAMKPFDTAASDSPVSCDTCERKFGVRNS